MSYVHNNMFGLEKPQLCCKLEQRCVDGRQDPILLLIFCDCFALLIHWASMYEILIYSRRICARDMVGLEKTQLPMSYCKSEGQCFNVRQD